MVLRSARLPEATQADLRRFMPGGPGLARYEWRKHGACSGLSPESYFAAVARLGPEGERDDRGGDAGAGYARAAAADRRSAVRRGGAG